MHDQFIYFEVIFMNVRSYLTYHEEFHFPVVLWFRRDKQKLTTGRIKYLDMPG